MTVTDPARPEARATRRGWDRRTHDDRLGAADSPPPRRHHRGPGDRGQRGRRAAQRRRDLPGHARSHRAGSPHDRLPDLRLLAGRDRHRAGRPTGGPGRRGVRVRVLLDSWGARTIEPTGHRDHGGRGCERPVVPAAATVPASRRAQPPDPPQGADRRRGGRLHRRRRHRRRVGRRRPQRARVARHPLPHPGTRRRRAARRVPRQLGRDRPGPLRRRRPTASRSSPSPATPSSSASAARPRPGSATSTCCSAPCSSSPATRVRIATAYFVPDDELCKRLVRGRRPWRRGPDPPSRPSRRQAVRAAGRASDSTIVSWITASRSGTSSPRCCTPRS